MSTYLGTVTEAEFPHGLRCGRCQEVMEWGSTYLSEPLADPMFAMLVHPGCAASQQGRVSA